MSNKYLLHEENETLGKETTEKGFIPRNDVWINTLFTPKGGCLDALKIPL